MGGERSDKKVDRGRYRRPAQPDAEIVAVPFGVWLGSSAALGLTVVRPSIRALRTRWLSGSEYRSTPLMIRSN